MNHYIIIVLFALSSLGCKQYSHISSPQKPSITVSDYGELTTGELIKQYTLTTPTIRVKAINYGGIITHIEVPDRYGKWQDVVLGYDNLADYQNKNRYFGALIGRYANRIEQGIATIEDETVQLNINRPPHQLHGGLEGFDKQVWTATTEQYDDRIALHLTLVSPDGHEGYPGELHAQVSYIVTLHGELLVEYRATSNKKTIFNPTQHSYFNLSGNGASNILDHQLTLNANTFVELNTDSIPTGNMIEVDNTPFDFRQAKLIGRDIFSSNNQLRIGRGYDHYFIAKEARGTLTEIAHLYHQRSGRSLRVYSTEQGAQIYSANYLNHQVIGKQGIPARPHQGICIETGQLPNAPAEKRFKQHILTPDKPFYSLTTFAFSVK